MHRQIVILSGDDWQVGSSPADADPASASWSELGRVREWFPALIPGNIRAELMQAGQLPDLHVGSNPEAAQWVDDHCWWLVRSFPLALAPLEQARLVLRGVDYISDLFLNGHHLGRHEGMFSPQIHEITALLGSKNQLAVRILGAKWLPSERSTGWDRLLNRADARFTGLSNRFPHRRDTLKCQMSYGWDFAPPLRTMGIWDDVYIVVSEQVWIGQVGSVLRSAADGAYLEVLIEVDSSRALPVELRCTLLGETFHDSPAVVSLQVELPQGPSRHTMHLPVPKPHLWWPWDHGPPDLYRLSVEVWNGGRRLDSLSQTIGLREITLEEWGLHVNGRPVYARGANWVPADLFPGRVRAEDYDALLNRAREANMNMLRVWGGGLREKRAFYDLCDRLGILVWQELPFACAFLGRYPRSQDYLALVSREARAIVHDLRHHASLALWCGGNEFSLGRNAPLVATLRQAVTEGDPTRPFLPASPASGDRHNWEVWHGFHPPSRYQEDASAFASEFGLQATPDLSSLRRFIPDQDLWPPGPSWAYHGAGLEKLWRYAQPFLTGEKVSLETFVQASQRAQAQGLQIAIEHFRRQKAAGGGGALIWQFNEPWPAISWSLLDFYRRPKPAYEAARRSFNPLLVSMEYPLRKYGEGDHFRAVVWIIQDSDYAVADCQLEIVLWDQDSQVSSRYKSAVNVAACSAERLTTLDWRLPPGGQWRLSCALTHRGQIVSANEYELAIHDEIEPTLRQRIRTACTNLFIPA